MIAVEGNDVGSNANKFREVLRNLATGNDDDHFKLATKFSELKTIFEDIAKRLIDRWNNLVCFVPPSYNGRVRWTLGESPTPKIDKPYKFSIGVIAVHINGLSMKYFTGRRWAMQTDIGFSFFYYDEMALHQTFMWEPRLVNSDGLNLHGMLGAGVGVGVAYGDLDIVPQGIAGLEFIFGIPLTLQFDVRPMSSARYRAGALQIGFNISARYYFK